MIYAYCYFFPLNDSPKELHKFPDTSYLFDHGQDGRLFLYLSWWLFNENFFQYW